MERNDMAMYPNYFANSLGLLWNPVNFDVTEAVARGKNVLIHGGNKTGKTTLALAAALYFRDELWPAVSKVVIAVPTEQHARAAKQQLESMCAGSTDRVQVVSLSSKNQFRGRGRLAIPTLLVALSAESLNKQRLLEVKMWLGDCQELIEGVPSVDSRNWFSQLVYWEIAFGKRPGSFERIHIQSTEVRNIPGLAVQEWVDDMRASLGAQSDMYRARVLGLPPASVSLVVGADFARNSRDIERIDIKIDGGRIAVTTDRDDKVWLSLEKVEVDGTVRGVRGFLGSNELSALRAAIDRHLRAL